MFTRVMGWEEICGRGKMSVEEIEIEIEIEIEMEFERRTGSSEGMKSEM